MFIKVKGKVMVKFVDGIDRIWTLPKFQPFYWVFANYPYSSWYLQALIKAKLKVGPQVGVITITIGIWM